MLKSFVKSLDLLSWDNAFPLVLILAFALWAAGIGAGLMEFGIPLEPDVLIQIYVALGVQTTAGIFAIIVTLSLVAIQFASQEYSHRIMQAYIRSLMLWSTIAVFLLVMVSNVLFFSSPDVAANQSYTSISVVGTILAFALLIPHFLVTAAYLRPEFIIAKLLRRVDDDYLETMTGASETHRRWIGSRTDRLLPIIEIIERSIDKGDVTTTRAALDRIYDTYSRHTPGAGVAQVQKYFLDYLLRVGRKAISESDEEASATQVIDIMGAIGASGAADAAVESIGILGMSALKKEFEPVVHQMIDALHTIAEAATTVETRESVLGLYDDLAGDLVVGERRRLLEHVTTQVAKMADAAIRVKHHALLERCLRLLELIGHDSASHNMVDVTLQVARSLQKLGVEVAREDVNAADRIVRIMLRVERPVDVREREPLAQMEFAKREVERAIEKARSQQAGRNAPQPVPETPSQVSRGRDNAPETAPPPVSGLWREEAAGKEKATDQPASPLAGLWSAPATPAAASSSPSASAKGADGGRPDPAARPDGVAPPSQDADTARSPVADGQANLAALWDAPAATTPQEGRGATPAGGSRDPGPQPELATAQDLWGAAGDEQKPDEPREDGRAEERKAKQAKEPEEPLSATSLWGETQKE